jgi:CubicO group peptidase (beta-lactamase class C family)
MQLNRHRCPRPRFSCWVHLALLIAFLLRGLRYSGVRTILRQNRADRHTHVPGLSVAVVENGEYEWAQGFGVADLESNVPSTEHTLSRLASISKALPANAATHFWERGHLDLDAPLQKYCPSFPQKSWPISTRQVLGPWAGTRRYKSSSQDDPEVGNTKHFDDPIQAGLNFFKDDPLVAPARSATPLRDTLSSAA